MANPRDVRYIVAHCTATAQHATVESIQAYWRNNLGWRNPGYHYLVKPDGVIVQLLPEDGIANGVKGYNPYCIHVSYIGGIDKDGKPVDNRTGAQRGAMRAKIQELSQKYPKAEVLGHRDFYLKYGSVENNKACPCFDVATQL
jgi:N-acetylmuramoyl-L-alanine amidase